MNIELKNNIYKRSRDLTIFLNSDDDGVFYTGHASILVRLNKKKYLFDYINNTNFYRNSWIFFPNQIIDNRLFDVDGVFVSHIHQDHYDPNLLRKFQKKNIPVYILDGRPGFKNSLKKERIKAKYIQVKKKTYINKDTWVYGCLHEYNDIDSSMLISNNKLSVYHGNDNFITNKTLIPFKKKVGSIDVACIPFAYINYYPYLLNGISKKINKSEATRIENLFMNYGIQQSRILKPKIIIPFGSNLFHLDNPKCEMNRGVATPSDFVNYAKKKDKSFYKNYKTMLSGSFLLKKDNKIKLSYEEISQKKFNNELIKFTNKKKKLAKKNKKIKIININKIKLKVICEKIKKNKNKVNHNIVVSPKSKKDTKIIINLRNDTVIQVKQTKIPEKCHYFIVEDNEFNLWLNNKITFEEVLGTRRFRYNRNPNIYRVEINQIYTNFL
jgi:L-ascorbate metabolism protein UlaG (beta-lactamase superfamily)